MTAGQTELTSEEERTARFWKWVRDTMREKELSFHKIEIDAGLGNATIGARARDNLPPTETVFEAIAQAFNMPKRKIMEIAGAIELPAEMSDEEFRRLYNLVRHLTPDEVEQVIRYVQFTYGDKIQ